MDLFFFSKLFSEQFLTVLEHYYNLPGTEQFYWENVYMEMLSGEAAKRLPHIPEAKQDIDLFVNRGRPMKYMNSRTWKSFAVLI